VQRLVEVRLRDRDVVVELPGHRRPEGVDDAERRVAGRHVGDDHADREEVIDLVEADVLSPHLLGDRPEMLRASGDVRLDARLLELAVERLHRVVDVTLAHLPAGGEVLGDLLVVIGLEHLEGEILELPLDLPDAEAVRERGVDLDRLARDAPLLVLRK
jgi:hypothetical protein